MDFSIEREYELQMKLMKMEAVDDFCMFLAYINHNYEAEWFHREIARRCMAVLKGDIKKLMIFIPPQHGKALDINTPVLTANRGFVRHGELVAGDFVFNPNGEQVKVLATTEHYTCDCSDIQFVQGETIRAALQHEWGCYIPNSDHKAVYYPQIETQNIWGKKSDRSPFIMVSAPIEYETADLPIPPYLLGLWLGDVNSQCKYIYKPSEDLDFFIAQYSGKIHHQKAHSSYVAFDEMDGTLLRSIGVLKNKHIPVLYLTASVEQRKALLQGLMDTDGSCDKRGNCEIVQVRERLAYDILRLIRSLGYKPRLIMGEAKIYGRKVSEKYRICFNPDKGDDIFRLPRKLERLRNKTKSDRSDKYKHFIKNITHVGECEVNCIQVEGGYYLAGESLITTHNSEIISRSFPAWALGRNPDLKIVGCSYSADLASQFSRSIQRIIDSDDYKAIFPDTRLNGAGSHKPAKGWIRKLDTFEMVGRSGFYKAVGVGGGLTGTPVDIAIIDDPIKDAQEAYSATYRSRVWEWYNSVLTTRLHNDSRQIFIMTRWHEDDLAGRILKAEPDAWNVLSIPAICEEEGDGDLHSPRHAGDCLWPEKHSLQKLLSQKARAPREFSALYQQHPSIEGGNIVKRDWFQHITLADFKFLRGNEPMHFYLDTAYNKKKKNTDNDPSGILSACKIRGNIYIVHAQQVWKEMPDLLRFLPEYMLSHDASSESRLCVEPKANGVSVVQMLRETTALNVKETPTPTEDKEVRLRVVSPRIECGRVFIVEGNWNEDFFNEVCGFPAMPHDEFVDILGYAINDLYEEDDDIDYDAVGQMSFK